MLTYTKNITVRVEPELWEAFRILKEKSSIDIEESKRIAWRELVEKLKSLSQAS